MGDTTVYVYDLSRFDHHPILILTSSVFSVTILTHLIYYTTISPSREWKEKEMVDERQNESL